MDLAPKSDLIYGLQQVTGKILKTKKVPATLAARIRVLGCKVSAGSELGQAESAGFCFGAPFGRA
jgi:hypothetical protein